MQEPIIGSLSTYRVGEFLITYRVIEKVSDTEWVFKIEKVECDITDRVRP